MAEDLAENKLAALEAEVAALEKRLEIHTNSKSNETPDASVSKDNKTKDEGEDSIPSKVPRKESLVQEDYAFTLRKFISDDPSDDNNSEIEIESPALWELMKKCVEGYPYHIYQGNLPKTLDAPFEAIIFNWDNLLKATQIANNADQLARDDLRALLEIIDNGTGSLKLDNYLRKRRSLMEQKLITFEALWTLFPPGCLVYGKVFQDQDQVFIVEDNTRPWPSRDTFDLKCWAYDWDGYQFKRLPLRLKFDSFDDEKPINSLPYYPLKFNEDSDGLRSKLMQRGMKYRKLCTAKSGSQMFEYLGQASFLKKGFSGLQGLDEADSEPESDFISRDIYGFPSKPSSSGHFKKSVEVRGRIMVDFQSYFRYGLGVASIGDLIPDEDHTECQCSSCHTNVSLQAAFRSHFDGANTEGSQWDPEQFLVCPPRVLGYILHEKQWAQLQVDSVSEVAAESHSAWSNGLKLASQATKKMILDLVTGHGQKGLEVEDIVESKGKGLVILLYAPPPGVADVGTSAKHVEANLARIFALATTWQAIILIDEADVFLQSRSLGSGFGSNTERNALVSVFLRVLEYYQGILMLTTNQIAQFDVAVHSRIHVAIKYEELNETRAMSIFKNFLTPLEDKGMIQSQSDILDWLEGDIHRMKFDGRQIRNVVTSACSLARAQGKTRLEKQHLLAVVDNVKDFKNEFVRQYEGYKLMQKGSA
ncbi:hypothetical protein N7495_010053 [Penicillium taxi]|uniref:uncharacterized protein n=1 Tax=Penicillium taxi TaxID=168475 RepID=UPI0025453844|nr:uncharacterized protein N7495_010053 [Penicillium taxi]KAJ5885543.1 hypothetical protein N7495_010053 [Penicillium taxi]